MVCQKLDRVLFFFLFRLNPVFFFFQIPFLYVCTHNTTASQRILVVFLTEWGGAVEGPVMWVNKRARAPETLSVFDFRRQRDHVRKVSIGQDHPMDCSYASFIR